MKLMIMKMMILISMLIVVIMNPMSMGLLLLIQTILAILYMNMILTSSWFMMITFLMMVGGLLILIMYMTSIASNEKFKLNINLSLMLIIMLIYTESMMSENLTNENQNLLFNQELNFSLLKIYNIKSMYITLMLVIYLLLTMMSVSKIVKFFEGPLRMFSYE
nr:NADH dehydrogenase subunit 6 [Alebroides salicis]